MSTLTVYTNNRFFDITQYILRKRVDQIPDPDPNTEFF